MLDPLNKYGYSKCGLQGRPSESWCRGLGAFPESRGLQGECLLAFTVNSKKEPNGSTFSLGISSARYPSSLLPHSAFHKTAGHNLPRLPTTIEQGPAFPQFPITSPSFPSEQSLRHPYFYQQSVQRHLGVFNHVPQNSILYPLTLSKATCTCSGIYYCSTPLPGTTICISFPLLL